MLLLLAYCELQWFVLPAVAKHFPFLRDPQTGWGVNSVFTSTTSRGCFQWGYCCVRLTITLYSDEDKNDWSNNSAPPVCFQVVQGNFYLYCLQIRFLIFFTCYITLFVIVSFSVACHAWSRRSRRCLIVLHKVNYIYIFYYLGPRIKFPYIFVVSFVTKYAVWHVFDIYPCN